MPVYLAKYRPLNSTTSGQQAVEKFGLPPYIDGSCRREPDFQSEFPSISAICRGKLFAPRLRVGDEVIYITMKVDRDHWWMVARLKIRETFPSHAKAAAWYLAQGAAIPSNCMLPGSTPYPLDQTTGAPTCGDGCGKETLVEWDARYQKRADEVGIFHACDAMWLHLYEPTLLTERQFVEIVGDHANARMPFILLPNRVEALQRMVSENLGAR